MTEEEVAKKAKKRRRILLIVLLVVIVAAVGVVLFVHLHTDTVQEVTEEVLRSDSDYSSEERIEAAMQSLSEDPQEAEVVTDINTVRKQVAICFEGDLNDTVAQQILILLEQHDVTATFFVTAMDVSENTQLVKDIIAAGHTVQSYSMEGTMHMEELSTEELVTDFCRSQEVFDKLLGDTPTMLKCNATDYTTEVLQAAKACGFDEVLYSTHPINYSSFSDEETVKNYVNNLDKGSILTIKLSGYIDEIELDEETNVDDRPAYDKQAGVELHEEEDDEVSESARLIEIIGWLLDALDESDYSVLTASRLQSVDMENLQAEAMETLNNSAQEAKKAEVISSVSTEKKQVALCFEGDLNKKTVKQVLKKLDKYKMTATFFVTGNDVINKESLVHKIIDAGHDVQCYTMKGTTHMENMTKEELTADFCEAMQVFEEYLGVTPNTLKCNSTTYTSKVLKAAYASGFPQVLSTTNTLNYTSFASKQKASEYVGKLANGSIVTIKLSGYIDAVDTGQKNTDKDQDDDHEKKKNQKVIKKSEQKDLLIDNLDWFLAALSDKGFSTCKLNKGQTGKSDNANSSAKKKSSKNKSSGKSTSTSASTTSTPVATTNIPKSNGLAEVITSVHTTDRECAFVFSGIGNKKELNQVLKQLNSLGIKATFFVTGKEAEKYPDRVKKIKSAGHEIGTRGYSGRYMSGMTYAQACEDIEKADAALRACGISTKYLMPIGDGTGTTVRKAAAAEGKTIVAYTACPTRQDYVKAKYSASQVVSKYWSDNRLTLCRGDIVYFNMDIYNDKSSVANLVAEVYKQKIKPTQYETSILTPVTMTTFLDNTWTYPASSVSGTIAKSGKMAASYDTMLSSRYIGSPWVALEDFSKNQLKKLDTTGRVDTGSSNTVFLTFDDWGDERSIGQLLYVLKKHNVKATFFVKTDGIIDGSTENLLRAIAEDGHDIASHTNDHKTINIKSSEKSWLKNDLVKCYSTLEKVVGDTGALTKYFRPPTLAINQLGAKTVFDCGFSYIVAGDVSTTDYSATSADQLLGWLKNGVPMDNGSGRYQIQKGSVVVMHMSTTAKYTAEAVDKYLSYTESLPKGDKKKYSFAKLSRYLK